VTEKVLPLMSEFNAIKLVLLGDSGVGKTSIVSQYVSGNAPENVNPTIGAAFVTKEVSVEGQNLELLIWDTAGQEVYRGLAPMYYRSALIAIIVFDVSNQESYNSVNYWIKELQTNVEENIVIIVCGNKIDLEEKRVVNFQAASAAAVEQGVLYAETSASSGTGIDRMFQVAISAHLKKSGKVNSDATQRVDLTAKPAGGDKGSGCC
jgi:Rab family protein